LKNDTQPSGAEWLASILSPGLEQGMQPQLNLAQRVIRKMGRILANV
jgi:hypothetical protein